MDQEQEPQEHERKTVAEVASALRKTRTTILRWISQGCPALPLGTSYLLNQAEVETWLRARGSLRKPGKGAA